MAHKDEREPLQLYLTKDESQMLNEIAKREADSLGLNISRAATARRMLVQQMRKVRR